MTEEKNEELKVEETPEENEEVKDEEEAIEKNEQGNIVIPDLTKDQAKEILDKMSGMIFKVGPAFFKVVYQNHGRMSFSASMINDIRK